MRIPSLSRLIFSLLACLTLLSSGNPEEPGKQAARYHKLLLKKPENRTIFNRFLNAWLDEGSRDGLTSWLKTQTESERAADWRILSTWFETIGQEQDAVAALDKAVESDAESPPLRLARARLRARLLNFDGALTDLELAMKADDSAVEAAKLRGTYLARSGRVEEALKAWTELSERFPKDQELREDLIELQVQEGAYEQAVATSRSLIAITKDPYQKALRELRLGDLLLLAGKRQETLTLYESLVGRTGEGSWLEREVLAQIKRVFTQEDDAEGLRTFYNKLREAHPRRTSLRLVLAHQLAEVDELDEAVALYREVLTLNPGNEELRADFLNFLEQHTQWEQARTELEALLKTSPENPAFYEQMARVQAGLGNPSGVTTSLNKLAELAHDQAQELIRIASLFEQAEQSDQAETLLRQTYQKFSSEETGQALATHLIRTKDEQKTKEALTLWKDLAAQAEREGLLRITRSLSAHGQRAEGYTLLESRLQEFQNDRLILAQLTQLADSPEQAKSAIPHTLTLVRSATTPLELQSDIDASLRTIRRAKVEEELIQQLTAAADLPSRVLLARLLHEIGDDLKAEQVFAAAIAEDPDTLVLPQQASFEESRGNIDKAITLVRDMIEKPDGRRPDNFRRLSRLHQLSGDFDQALKVIDEWKQATPGDRSAWLQRADILGQNGQEEEAVKELRRVVAKFGQEPDLQARLAGAMVHAGQTPDAMRLYEQLYEESETLNDKMRWVGELAQLAEREGTQEELLEDFSRRKRANPRAIAPLLGLAEVYRTLDMYEERRNSLLEASRRRPDDLKLLHRLADIEADAQEYERAVAILREAISKDRSDDSKRQLIRLQLSHGETEAAVTLMAELGEEMNDPRQLEKTVLAFAKVDPDEALILLRRGIGRYPQDWRLSYLEGMLLIHVGEHEAALQVLEPLLQTNNELKGVKPAVPQNQYRGFYSNSLWQRIMKVGVLQEIFGLLNQLQRQSYQQLGGFTTILPGTADEVKAATYLSAHFLLTQAKNKHLSEVVESRFVLPELEYPWITLIYGDSNQQDGRKRLAEMADKPDSSMVLCTMNLLFNPITNEALDKYEKRFGTIKARERLELLSNYNSAVNLPEGELIGLIQDVFSKEEPDQLEHLWGAIQGHVFGTYRQYQMPDFQENTFTQSTKVRDLIFQLAREHEDLKLSYHGELEWIKDLVAEKKLKEAASQIGKFVTASRQMNQPSSSWPRIHFSHHRGRRGSLFDNESLSIEQALPQWLSQSFRAIFPLEKVGQAVNHSGFSGIFLQQEAANEFSDLGEALKDLLSEIEDPFAHALATLSVGDESAQAEALTSLRTSSDLDSLRFVAAWDFADQPAMAFATFQKMSTMNVDRQERQQIDVALAQLGAKLMEDEEQKIDVQIPRRAALRLRRAARNPEDRQKLVALMNRLGLENEVEKLNRVPQRLTTNRKSSSFQRQQQQHEQIAQLVRDDKKDAAARLAARALKQQSRQSHNNWHLRQIAEIVQEHKLTDDVIELLDPKQTKSFKRRLEFAEHLTTLGKKERARSILSKLVDEKPESIQTRVALVTVLPEDQLTLDAVLPLKEGQVDFSAAIDVFPKLWSSIENEREFSSYLAASKLSLQYLKETPTAELEKTNLTWLPQQLWSFAGTTYMNGSRPNPLFDEDQPLSGTPRRSENCTEDHWPVLREIFEKCLHIPALSRQGFILLQVSQKSLEISDEKMSEHAQLALTQSLKLNEQEYAADLWASRIRNHHSSYSSTDAAKSVPSPFRWLVAQRRQEGKTGLPEELAKIVQESSHSEFANFLTAQSIADADPSEASRQLKKWSEAKKRSLDDWISLANSICTLQPLNGPWADEMDQAIFHHPEFRNKAMRHNFNVSAYESWFIWRASQNRFAGEDGTLMTFLTMLLGPPEKWPKTEGMDLQTIYQKLGHQGHLVLQAMQTMANNTELARALILTHSQQAIPFFDTAISQTSEFWLPRYEPAANMMSHLKKCRWLAPSDAELPTKYVAMLLENLSEPEFTNERKHRPEFAKLIEKEEEFDPILRRLFAAAVARPERARIILAKFLPDHHELVTAIGKEKPELIGRLTDRWYPNETLSKEPELIRKTLATFKNVRVQKLRQQGEQWAQGKDLPNLTDEDKVWDAIFELAKENGELAGKALGRIFDQLYLNPPRNSSYRRNGINITIAQRWAEDFVRRIFPDGNGISDIGKIVLFDAIYRSKAEPVLLEPSFNDNGVAKRFGSRITEFAIKEGELKVVQSFRNYGGQTTPEQQLSLLCYVLKDFKNWKWPAGQALETARRSYAELKDEHPNLADAAAFLCAYLGEKSDAQKEKALTLARRHVFAFANHPDLPIALRTKVLFNLAEQAPDLFEYPEGLSFLSETIRLFRKGSRPVAATRSLDTLQKLTKQKFTGLGQEVAALLKELQSFTNLLPVKSQDDLRKLMSHLAFVADDPEILKKYLARHRSALRGNLGMMLRLAELDLTEEAAKLWAKGDREYLNEFIHWNAQLSTNLEKLLPALPEAARYRVEFLVKSRFTKDDRDRGTAVLERLQPLMNDFEEKAPKAKLGRLQMLHFLARFHTTAEPYADLIHEVAKKETLAEVARLRSKKRADSDPVFVRTICTRSIDLHLQAENLDPVMAQIDSLHSLVKRPQNNSYYAHREAEKIFGHTSLTLALHALRGKKEAVWARNAAKKLFLASLTFTGNDLDAIKAAEGGALLTHIIAGSGRDWETMVNTFTGKRRETYQRARKSQRRYELWDNLKSLEWLDAKHNVQRTLLMQALLKDDYWWEREIKDYYNLYGLVERRWYAPTVLATVIKDLPDDHPRKMPLMVFRALSLGHYQGDKEDLCTGAFEDALKLAESTDEALFINATRLHFSYRLWKWGKKERAIELAEKVDFTPLKKHDSKWGKEHVKSVLKQKP